MSVVMLQKEMGMTFRTIQGLVLVGFLGLTACARLMADDGADPKVISALRQELEELRSENRSLREENSVLRKENRELREESKRSDASSGESKDQIVGKIWRLRLRDEVEKSLGQRVFWPTMATSMWTVWIIRKLALTLKKAPTYELISSMRRWQRPTVSTT